MHTVAQRQEMPLMDFPHHPHAHHSHGHAPRRGNTTTALDTQNIESMKHHHQSQSQSHMRVNSLSSGGSLSDYSTILRTPQDSVQSDNDALISKQQDDGISGANGWKPSMGMVQETLTSSPIEETFSRGGGQGTAPAGGKPMPMQINTTFVPRSRPMAYSAHPNQKTAPSGGASQLNNAPQSATAAFPPMQLPSSASGATPATATGNGVTGRHTQFMGRGMGVGAETKHSDASRHQQQYQGQPHPSQGQHRRTQSAPLLSLSPLAPTASTPIETPGNNPLTPSVTSAAGFGGGRLSYPQPQQQQQDLQSLQPSNYPQINPMAQAVAAASFTPFPTMPGFQGSIQAVPSLMWPPFFAQQTAPGGFYSQRPPAGPPGGPMANGANNMYSPQPVMPTTQWKINPNSQPQMPLSHLINQAQGLLVGGPSAHNRKIGLYKTEICRNWEEKQSCRYGVKCQFAHGTTDVRNVPRHPKYKTEICRTFWVTGSCPYGKRCCFIHPTATSHQSGPLSPQGPPLSGGGNGNMSPSGMDDQDRETQHAISLLARLDIKRGSPDQFNGNGSNARQTPDSNVSDPSSGFVYPGLHLNGHSNGIDGERSASVPRI